MKSRPSGQFTWWSEGCPPGTIRGEDIARLISLPPPAFVVATEGIKTDISTPFICARRFEAAVFEQEFVTKPRPCFDSQTTALGVGFSPALSLLGRGRI